MQDLGALAAVVMKIYIVWDIAPCSPLKAGRRFGGTRHLHLQDQRINEARNQCEAGGGGGDMFLQNVSWLLVDFTALCTRRWNS
jgi:hypothetical protein